MAAFAPDQGAMQSLTHAVTTIIAPAIEAAGIYLEDVSIHTVAKRSVVQVVVDLPQDRTGGLDLDALGDVSRVISLALDDSDPFPGEYTLEVSTPGVSRPLTERRHFSRARTRVVELTLFDGTVVVGRVRSVDDDSVTLDLVPDTKGKQASSRSAVETRVVAIAEVKQGEVQVEFSRSGSDEIEEH